STPSTPAQIIRLTAFPPPPPTPITLIFALLRGSSLNWIRTSPFVFASLIHHTPDPLGSADIVTLGSRFHLPEAHSLPIPTQTLSRDSPWPLALGCLAIDQELSRFFSVPRVSGCHPFSDHGDVGDHGDHVRSRHAPSFAINARSLLPKPCSGFILATVVRCAYIASPTAVENSGSASCGGISRIGSGDASRTGRSRTCWQTSASPFMRDPPPVSTTPAAHKPSTPACFR